MKQLTALILAIVVTVAMTVGIAAAVPSKIKTIHDQFAQRIQYAELDGYPITAGDLTELSVQAGSELRIYLIGPKDEPQLFFDQSGKPVASGEITLARLRAAQIEVEYTESGETVVEQVELSNASPSPGQYSHYGNAPYIRVSFLPGFIRVDDTAFSIELQLSLGGVPQEQSILALSGIMTARQQSLTGSSPSADLSEGTVAVAEENLSGAQLYMGNGVTVIADLVEGQQVCGYARVEEDGASPRAYSLQGVNLGGSGDKVRIESAATMYVYDGEGLYLGTTRQELPYRNRYFLTTNKSLGVARGDLGLRPNPQTF